MATIELQVINLINKGCPFSVLFMFHLIKV